MRSFLDHRYISSRTPTVTSIASSSSPRMPLAVWVLTLAAFAIGTAEFVIAGILLQVAESLGISDGAAGNLILSLIHI